MFKSMKQDGNLVFFCALLGAFSLFLILGGAAYAATPDVGGPAGAGGKDDVSSADLFGGIGDAFDSLFGSSSGKKAADDKGKKDEASKTEGGTIKAKRLDAGADGKPPVPYKVYPAPPMLDESGVDLSPVSRSRVAAQQRATPTFSAFSGWEDSRNAQKIDPTKPPPLPPHALENLDAKNESGAASGRLPSPAQMEERAASAKQSGVPPVSALPKQFFPILPLGAGDKIVPQLMPVASNQDLEADHSDTLRAIIMIHDMTRNAAEGVATLMTLNGADGGTTLILAPQFPLALDILRFAQYLPDDGRSVARWSIEQGWEIGSDSVPQAGQKGVSSFTATDLLLMFLSDRRRFPALQQVVVAGHGAGADFVQRYAAVSNAPDLLEKQGIGVRFIVANPSSYLYFTSQRPSENGPSFVSVGGKQSCPTINAYPYGLENLNAYARRTGASTIRLRYPERKITYLVGEKILSDNYLDHGCAADAQGRDRTSRGRNFARYLSHSFGDELGQNQTFVIVPRAGFDPIALFGSQCGMESLFGNGYCGG